MLTYTRIMMFLNMYYPYIIDIIFMLYSIA